MSSLPLYLFFDVITHACMMKAEGISVYRLREEMSMTGRMDYLPTVMKQNIETLLSGSFEHVQ
jgi:hypothetical protein